MINDIEIGETVYFETFDGAITKRIVLGFWKNEDDLDDSDAEYNYILSDYNDEGTPDRTRSEIMNAQECREFMGFA